MNAKSFFKNNWPLITLYLFVVGLCAFLNWGKKEEINRTGLFISIVMLALVMVIFAFVLVKSFVKLDEMTETLDAAKNKIINDQKEDKFLWTYYQGEQKTSLISTGPLLPEYKRFEHELNRLENGRSGYRCTIEDYINEDVIDQKASKSLLGMVPGAMTGMGILGTFIGLAIGLQGLNIGAPDEMMNSFPTLMDGLKVAFHTSIYGMTFNLVFNLISKAKLEKTYHALNAFLTEFSRSVLPDATNENQSRMLREQQVQNAEIIKNLRIVSAGQLEVKDVFSDYSQNLYKDLSYTMSRLADDFVDKIGESLIGDFTKMQEIVEKTDLYQAENSKATYAVLAKMTSMTEQLNKVNRLSEDSVNRMQGYINNMNSMQTGMNDFMDTMNAQMEAVRKQSESVHNFILQISENENRLTETVRMNTEATGELLDRILQMQKIMMENAQAQNRELVAEAKAQNEILSKTAEAQMKRMEAYVESQAKILNDIAKNGGTRKNFLVRIYEKIIHR